ncbi:MAG: hypothetical protein QNL44_07375, partial [Oceanospirillaceae bacterium]
MIPIRRRWQSEFDGAAAAIAVGVATALFALALGAYKIGRSFNYDESVTYALFIRGGSIEKALTTQFVLNNHPLFSAIQAVGWRIGLVGETSQRAGPVIAGAMAAGLTSWAVTRRVGAIGGAAAGTFLVLNPIFLGQFRILRGYSLATLGVVVAALAVRRSWDDHRVRWLVLQGIAMFVAVAAHAYSALALVLVAIVTLGLGRLRWTHLLTWSIAAACAIALRLPILDYELEQSRRVGQVYKPDFARTLAETLLGRQGAIVWVSLVLCIAGIVTVALRSTRHAIALASCVFVVVTVVWGLWQIAQPAFLFIRFFVALVPFVA